MGDFPTDAANRARAWRRASLESICDDVELWSHGTVHRATRFPDYYDYNVVSVERTPAPAFEDLIIFADEALAGMGHRRIDVEDLAAGETLRPAFLLAGWRTMRLVWMRHECPLPSGPTLTASEVPFEVVNGLRERWHAEDFPDSDLGSFREQERAVAEQRNSRVLAVFDDGAPVAFAQLERPGSDAEVAQVYVSPEHRGRGLGTAVTRAAIEMAADAAELWIAADDEDRAKHLYARLGFRPAWTMMQFLLVL